MKMEKELLKNAYTQKGSHFGLINLGFKFNFGLDKANFGSDFGQSWLCLWYPTKRLTIGGVVVCTGVDLIFDVLNFGGMNKSKHVGGAEDYPTARDQLNTTV